MAEIDLTPADSADVLAEIRASIQRGNPVHPVQIHTGSSRVKPAAVPSGPLAELQALSLSAASELHHKTAQLDSIPPTPATLRGSIGRAAIRILRRLLWWNTQSINEAFNAGQNLAQAQVALSVAIAQKTGDLLDGERLITEGLSELRNRQAKLEVQLDQKGYDPARILERLEALKLKLNQETQARELLAADVRDLVKLTEQLVRRIGELASDTSAMRAEIALAALERRQTGTAPAVELESTGSGLDSEYLKFENYLRGSREEIKTRQAVYLPVLEAAGIGRREAPVLDIGCGRGEWLELLRERGLDARGVDRSSAMYELCRALNLDVIRADFLEFLRALPSGSVGAVTAFHLVEHLTFARLVALLDEGSRVLRPGGLLILETPNRPMYWSARTHSIWIPHTSILYPR